MISVTYLPSQIFLVAKKLSRELNITITEYKIFFFILYECKRRGDQEPHSMCVESEGNMQQSALSFCHWALGLN